MLRLINNLDNRQVKLLSKRKIALVVRWHRHDCAGSIATQNIIRHPNRQFLTIDRVYDIATSKYTCFLFILLAFNIRFLLRSLDIRFNLFARIRIDQLRNQRMLRRQSYIRRAKQRVRTSCENCNLGVLTANRKLNFRADRSTNPILLHGFNHFRPIKRIGCL